MGTVHPAQFWEPMKNNLVHCTLCPKRCIIAESKAGFCSIRENVSGKLLTLGYGNPTGFAVDPIEKKPLYHFLPNSKTLSFGTVGCNMGCLFCQNWQTTKDKPNADYEEILPEKVVELALQERCNSISYTYNEPTIFYEYVVDIAKLAHKAGLKNVIVTNGFIEPEPRKKWAHLIDAANVDLKSFSETFYKQKTQSILSSVLETIEFFHKYKKTHLEITNLKIPTLNDSLKETKDMCKWIVNHVGTEHPLHFTAFHPDFKLSHLQPTKKKTLLQARRIARDAGIEYVYCGNIVPGEHTNTYCPKCKALLIKRGYFSVEENRIRSGNCPKCGIKIEGVFEQDWV